MNDGGPAFPSGESWRDSIHQSLHTKAPFHKGMTIRDYFAATAMIGSAMYERSQGGLRIDGDYRDMAQVAYAIADAMLAERERETDATD